MQPPQILLLFLKAFLKFPLPFFVFKLTLFLEIVLTNSKDNYNYQRISVPAFDS